MQIKTLKGNQRMKEATANESNILEGMYPPAQSNSGSTKWLTQIRFKRRWRLTALHPLLVLLTLLLPLFTSKDPERGTVSRSTSDLQTWHFIPNTFCLAKLLRVADPPQRAVESRRFRTFHKLRLTLRAQPRSAVASRRQ
jgi:hypothetical protein